MLTNKEFVLQTAKENGVKSFLIRDQRGDLVLFSDNSNTTENKYNELVSFFDNFSGTCKVELRNEANKGMYPQSNIYAKILIGNFDVLIEKKQSEKPIGSTNEFIGGSGIGLSTIRTYESDLRLATEKINDLKMEIFKLETKLENQRIEYERQLSEAKNSDAKVMTYLNQLSGIVAPTMNRAVNGLGSTENNQNNNKMEDTKQKVINAVNKLLSADPNFADNITKLATLAETNPTMYKQAVSILNKM